MLNFRTNSDPLADFRYALSVMEECSHLGLDDEYAGKLREVLLRHIGAAEAASSCRPVAAVRLPQEEEAIFA